MATAQPCLVAEQSITKQGNKQGTIEQGNHVVEKS